MSKSPFNSKTELVARKPFKCAGRSYKPGQPIKIDTLSSRKMEALYNSRRVMYKHEYEATEKKATKEEAKAKEIQEKAKAEKEDKKKAGKESGKESSSSKPKTNSK